jgi:hypothetical protein
VNVEHPVKTWSFYEQATRLFSGLKFSGNQSILSANIPAGHKALEGQYDHLSQRVDIETGQVVDYQPPQPSPDHEWDAATKRWRLKADVAERQRRREAALAQIRTLEAAQARPMREAALGIAGAVERLRAIDEQIAQLRVELA